MNGGTKDAREMQIKICGTMMMSKFFSLIETAQLVVLYTDCYVISQPLIVVQANERAVHPKLTEMCIHEKRISNISYFITNSGLILC